MRELSQQLVNTQEEERKSLSRELHDHVAQVLTGLRMGLGRIERIAAPLDARVAPAVAECRGLVDDMFNTVRGLALGLRPSMLDDFGLQAALEWHVRDFTGRSAMNVDLTMDGDFDTLPDKHRTCVYRVVQEALTNCARHASAQNVTLSVHARDGHLQVSVTDDGVGLNPIRRRNGLGLRGIDERVRELEWDDDDRAGGRRRNHGGSSIATARRYCGGATCACCWLTITVLSGVDYVACSRPLV